MKIPVKLKYLKLCQKDKDEKFSNYVKQFQNLTSQMKDKPNNNEIVKICYMNDGPMTWFLNSSPSNTFEELFGKVYAYEELQHVAVANKISKASVNIVTYYIPQEDKKKPNDNKPRDGHKENNKLC